MRNKQWSLIDGLRQAKASTTEPDNQWLLCQLNVSTRVETNIINTSDERVGHVTI